MASPLIMFPICLYLLSQAGAFMSSCLYHFAVPKTCYKTKGDPAFQAVAPRFWSILPLSVCLTDNVKSFKEQRKKCFFRELLVNCTVPCCIHCFNLFNFHSLLYCALQSTLWFYLWKVLHKYYLINTVTILLLELLLSHFFLFLSF